ncbi:hypothetical protein DFJ43DRAFT_621684 [Lentinula guzmanii]|uniref:Zn(2)-C6 fungal-type domain-containing protein n=1 Tax=Lentinula guzmanii TaxID=2804957 RepID=A0AA38N4Y9_9AGAR|nr:hypothetical protein DFJ43DRAFT_621684 [Lentinula guzmanii]
MSTNPANSPATRRRRAQIACRNCRKRKIKCVTNEEPPHNPCERCQRKGLVCEYVAVGEPSPPSTPALERSVQNDRIPLDSQGYAYAGGSQFPNSTYSTEPSMGNQIIGYPNYPHMGAPSHPAHLNPLGFPSEMHGSWPGPNTNAGMIIWHHQVQTHLNGTTRKIPCAPMRLTIGFSIIRLYPIHRMLHFMALNLMIRCICEYRPATR